MHKVKKRKKLEIKILDLLFLRFLEFFPTCHVADTECENQKKLFNFYIHLLRHFVVVIGYEMISRHDVYARFIKSSYRRDRLLETRLIHYLKT